MARRLLGEDPGDGGEPPLVQVVQDDVGDAALAAVADVMQVEPANLRQALVAIDPRTGAVRAYYGGPSGTGTYTTRRPSAAAASSTISRSGSARGPATS